MTTLQTPQSIHATIHQDAINEVAGFFNATTEDILNELLQNARRSGATEVEITTQEDQVTVTDNGVGISDPAAILAFGHTGWENKTAQSEHAAGMGFYALARSEQVRVRSKPQGGTAWQVNLTPDHFVGKMDAPVERAIGNMNSPGTTVTFSSRRDPEGDIKEAAKHYPLPVQLNGQRVEQRDFLHDAVHTEVWEGIRIGVYPAYRWSNISRMNFHGIIVTEPGLPRVPGIQKQWYAQTDVLDCPHLELTLPARREVIETRFMRDLRAACRSAIYRSMSLQTEPPDVPKKVQQEAASLGINLPDAAAVLEHWEPEHARAQHQDHRTRTWEKVSDDTVVIALEAQPADQQALARAAELNGAAGRLMKADEDLEGYDWYDRLPKAKSMRITVTKDGEDHDLRELRDNKQQLENQRPNRITFTLETVDKEGEAGKQAKHAILVLPSDLAFENEEEEYMDDNRPLITQDSEISAHELTNLMTEAFFRESDDSDSDSYETQKGNHEAASYRTALTLLSSKEDALKSTLANLINRHVIWEVPQGTVATTQIKDGRSVEVTVGKMGGEV